MLETEGTSGEEELLESDNEEEHQVQVNAKPTAFSEEKEGTSGEEELLDSDNEEEQVKGNAKLSTSPSASDETEACTTRNPFIDRRVAKYFDYGGGEKIFFGQVAKYFPPGQTKSRQKLWQISYDDGDDEDMNQSELHEAIELYEENSFLDNTKPFARRVTVSPTEEGLSTDDNEMLDAEHSEPSDSEDSSDEVISGSRKRASISYIESSDEEDDETNRKTGRFQSLKARKKYARLEEQAWLGNGDDEFSVHQDSDEEDLEAEEGFHHSELAFARPSRRRRSSDYGIPPDTPPALSPERILEVLQEIAKPADRALQKLLFDADFQFKLLTHQFIAVRKVAGVPETFPLHPGSQVMQPEMATMAQAIKMLESDENKCHTKGVLIADDMGLGKTVEAIAGAALRNAISAARGEKERPTVIVSPNDAVQVQWRDTLVRNGVLLERIQYFEPGQNSRNFGKTSFILLTRYTLQSEVKRVFENLSEDIAEHPEMAVSVLFPHATSNNLKKLKVQYQDQNSEINVRNTHRGKGESMTDCVTRLIDLCTRRMRQNSAEPVFQMLIIDEAHFLKNVTTFWGIGAGLMATHAYRSIPLTGTPYNNGPTDLAAMMTYVDAAKTSAKKGWWSNATSDSASERICSRVREWHDEYLVRRRKDDVLKDLVPKLVKSQIVSQYLAEQCVYDHYEAIIQDALKSFGELACIHIEENPILRQQLKDLFKIIMALLCNMRSANIHALLPGGREFTKQFSPTRCHLLSVEAHPKACVCCSLIMRPSIPIVVNEEDKSRHRTQCRFRGGTTNVDELEEFRETNDDALEMFDEEEEELVKLPYSLCEAHGSQVSHYAHKECIRKLQEERQSCPRCRHARNMASITLPEADNHKYCTHINGGFVGSSKINAVVKWYQHEVPPEDKVLILSFFKGGLDLLEGIFCHDLDVDCARFDGDLDRRESLAELERFKNDPDCKVLFATVQSGGVGLNLVEANHVAFLDRWYNPFVHQQAEDRCHRIGQTKIVNVIYFDCAATVDEAMVCVNKLKKRNSAILLADGFEIGNQQSLTYRDLSGVLGRLLATIRSYRTGWIESNSRDLPIPAVPQSLITEALGGNTARAARSQSRGSTDSKETEKTAFAVTNANDDAGFGGRQFS